VLSNMRRVPSLSAANSPSIVAGHPTDISNDNSQQFTTGLHESVIKLARAAIPWWSGMILSVISHDRKHKKVRYQVGYHASSRPNEDCHALNQRHAELGNHRELHNVNYIPSYHIRQK
jgi:hypothetical protein